MEDIMTATADITEIAKWSNVIQQADIRPAE